MQHSVIAADQEAEFVMAMLPARGTRIDYSALQGCGVLTSRLPSSPEHNLRFVLLRSKIHANMTKPYPPIIDYRRTANAKGDNHHEAFLPYLLA